MPRLSLWMVGYGLLLIACDLLDRFGVVALGTDGQKLLPGIVGGLIMVANGLASAQRRRSLRITGLYVGTFLALALAGIFTWKAAQLWQQHPDGPLLWTAAGSSALALASIGMVWLVVLLRPREGIASRGYAVTLSSTRRVGPQPPSAYTPEPAAKSEVR